MSGFSFQVPARPEDVLPAYVFYGADLFPARKFARELREALSDSPDEPAHVESFNLTDRRWREVLDTAKTLPFFFSPWRILAVEGKGAGQEGLSNAEATILGEYFASPAPKTTIILMFQGPLHKTKPLGKALWALPSSVVRFVEITQMKDKDLKPLVEERFAALGKRPTPEAVDRILDVTGSDIARIDSEINKLDIYLGPRTTVEADDVSALSSVKSFHYWELNAALESGDIEKTLVIINSQFDKGEAPELILAVLSGFFRDLLLAKSGLREGRDPKDVFREVKPQISEKFGGFYQKMLGEYLGLLDRIKDKDLLGWLTELQEMDRKLKSTDVSPKEMIQVFVVSYGRKISGRRITSSARR
jgi:DNA polymerase-3 subunit delta